MLKVISIYSSILFFAFMILIISIFRSAAVKYEFPATPYLQEFNKKVLGENSKVEYNLAYPGKVIPTSPVWPIKVVRDRAWLFFTSNPDRKAELQLLFADKRLAAAKLLFDDGKNEDAFSTLSKAEKYLEEASLTATEKSQPEMVNEELHSTLALAALKHYEVMNLIIENSPDEMHPNIISLQRYPKSVYETSKNVLLSKGIKPPDNPFSWN